MENLEIHETVVPTEWTPLHVKMDGGGKCEVDSEGGALGSHSTKLCRAGRRLRCVGRMRPRRTPLRPRQSPQHPLGAPWPPVTAGSCPAPTLTPTCLPL